MLCESGFWMKYLSVQYGPLSVALKGHESVCISVIVRVCNKRHLFHSCTSFTRFARGLALVSNGGVSLRCPSSKSQLLFWEMGPRLFQNLIMCLWSYGCCKAGWFSPTHKSPISIWRNSFFLNLYARKKWLGGLLNIYKLTIWNLMHVCIFSILFSVHFL